MDMTKLTPTRPLAAIAIAAALLLAFGCQQDPDPDPVAETDEMAITRLIAELPAAEDLYYAEIPPRPGEALTLSLHGGPSPVLATNDFEPLEDANLPIAHIRQYQMLNSDCLAINVKELDLDNAIWPADGLMGAENVVTPERSHECFLGTVAILRKVVDHFKQQNVQLNLISQSVGTFMASKYIATYGTTDFERIVLTTGRVDMPLEFVELFANGGSGTFTNGGSDIAIREPAKSLVPTNDVFLGGFDVQIEVEGDHEVELQIRTTQAFWLAFSGLQGAVARQRYSEQFANLDLSNLHYLTGRNDETVGRLTEAEQTILTTAGATVTVYDGTHAMFDTPAATEAAIASLRDGG